MIKRVFLFLLLSMFGFAKFNGIAIKECEAFNNLKHTKNRDNIHLKKGQNYLIYKEHKGQYLIKVDSNPAQRWVDKSCLAKSDNTAPLKSSAKEKNSSKDTKLVSVLVLSWQNTFCETHRNKRECKMINRSKEPSHLTLHGLWPQPRSNQYCGVEPKIIAKDKHHQWRALPKPKISPETQKLMEIYMPGFASGLDRHEWIKHGTCYSKDSQKYFHDALSLTKQVDTSIVGEYLRANEGREISLINLKRVFDRAFGKGASRHLEMRCKNRLLSELWIHIKGRGDNLKELLKDAPTAKSRCVKAIVDAKGYFRRR